MTKPKQERVYLHPVLLSRVHIAFSSAYDQQALQWLAYYKRQQTLLTDRVPPAVVRRLLPILPEDVSIEERLTFRDLSTVGGLNRPLVWLPTTTCVAGFTDTHIVIWFTFAPTRKKRHGCYTDEYLTHAEWLEQLQ